VQTVTKGVAQPKKFPAPMPPMGGWGVTLPGAGSGSGGLCLLLEPQDVDSVRACVTEPPPPPFHHGGTEGTEDTRRNA
jgi:hypothetical protein